VSNFRRLTAILLLTTTSVGAHADGPKQFEKLWADLDSRDPVVAEQVMSQLAAQPAQTVPFLREHLRPVSAPDPCRVARWLADLDSDDFATRERATRELEKRGEAVESALNEALNKSPSLEARRRIKGLLERVKVERFNPSADRRRAVRAVEVLERVGDAKARQLLGILARGSPKAQLTVEARAALERLEASR
jgi:hypothetical protein